MSTAKEARRAHHDTNATDYSAQVITLPAHTVCDLNETYRPQDLLDALRDLNFKHGPKTIRIDAQVRDYLVTAVSALSGHERKMKRCAEALTAAEVTLAVLYVAKAA